MKKPLFVILLIGAVGLLVGLFLLQGGKDPNASPETSLLGTKHEDQGQNHIASGEEHASYNSNPPSSGPHYVPATEWGVKDGEIPDETMVHNLEHGGITVAYKPDLAQEDIDKLKKLFEKLPKSKFNNVKAVVVPRPANDKPVMLAAWTYTHSLDSVDEEKIIQFYKDHIDKSPEQVP